MIRLEMKNVNAILIEKKRKYHHYFQVKLIYMNTFQVKKYYHLIKLELAKFTYLALCKAFEKKNENDWTTRKKQLEALEVYNKLLKKVTVKDVIPENTLSEEAINEINKIKEIEKTVDRENLYYQTNKNTYNFQNFRAIITFAIYL